MFKWLQIVIYGGSLSPLDGIEIFDIDTETVTTLADASGAQLKIPLVTEVGLKFSCAVPLPELNTVVITGGFYS